jgi:hypothetical protein
MGLRVIDELWAQWVSALGRLDVDDLELRLGPALIDPDQVSVRTPKGDLFGQVRAFTQRAARLKDELEGILLASCAL